MKRRITRLSIGLLGAFLLAGCTTSQALWKLEKKLNPERKKLWVVVVDMETHKFFRDPMKRYGISAVRGFGLGAISEVDEFIQSGYPSIVAFSPDQISQASFRRFCKKKYYYLFVIPISEMKKILAQDKCVIASRKERITTTREVLDKGDWMVISKTEEERYITLIAAPNKDFLKKSLTRFFALEDVPLDPVIFVPE